MDSQDNQRNSINYHLIYSLDRFIW